MKIKPYVFRKILHMIACAIVVTILMSLQSWTDVLIAAVTAIVIIYPLLYLFERYPAYQRFFVEKGRGEIRMSLVLLFGMLMVMTAIGWGIFDDRHAVLGSLLMWGFGDASAALVGIPYGKHRIGKKSLEGSLAMFVVAFALGLWGGEDLYGSRSDEVAHPMPGFRPGLHLKRTVHAQQIRYLQRTDPDLAGDPDHKSDIIICHSI